MWYQQTSSSTFAIGESITNDLITFFAFFDRHLNGHTVR